MLQRLRFMSDAVNLLTCNKMKILIKEINKQTTVQLSKLIQQNAVTPTNSFDRKYISTQKKISHFMACMHRVWECEELCERLMF